jgi:serine protease
MDAFIKRLYFVVIVTLMSAVVLFGQLQNEIPGEYIVCMQNESSILKLRNNMTQFRVSGNEQIFSYQQVMKTPLNLWLLKYKGSGQNEEDFIKQLKTSQEVIFLQKNRYISNRATPNDPDFGKQWQYKNDGASGGIVGADLDIERAWDISTGGNTSFGDTIVICVIDDGINGMHPDIAENIWINRHEIPSNGIDDDGNGFVDDYKGWNITSKNDNTWTGGSHGTPVAGIIGASGNNGKGVTGTNWRVKLLPVNYGLATEASALSSYEYAYVQRKLYNTTKGGKGAYIVATNASWGVDNLQAEEAPLWCALFDSLGSIGILNCGATTNSNTDVDSRGDMPTTCTSEYLISVTNMTREDVKLSSAGYGKKSIDLGSYGHQVFTLTRNDYGTFGGTSAATPHVTGVIGLIYATQCTVFQNLAKSDPAKAALVAKDMLLHGVLPNASMAGISTTNGKLNAYRTLKNTLSLCENCSPPAGIVLKPEEKSVMVSWVNNHGTAKINLRYRETGVNNWTEVNGIRNGDIIEGLKTCTEYEIQTGSDCGQLSQPFSYSKYVKTSGCCTAPIISPIISSMNSITLNWNGENDAIYKLSYKSSIGKWTDTIINLQTFSLKRVPECTAYSFKIQAFCKKFNNESISTPEVTASTSCGSCTNNIFCPIAKKDASQEWIESFTINNITNKSGTSKEGYRDFTGANNIVLDPGKTYDFFIKPGYSGSSFSDYFKIFVDFDQDGKWTLNEMIIKTESIRDSVKGQVKIPLSAVPGYTKLRVIMSYEKFEGACDHPDFEYGEVEDYCVLINNNFCPNKGEIQILSVDKNRALLLNNYFLQGVRDSIKMQYRSQNNIDWKTISGKDSITITNLQECTLYEFRYQLRCDSLLSEYSSIDTFSTSCKINTADEVTSLVSISPNPAQTVLKINTLLKPDNFTYSISNITGQTIVEEKPLTDKIIAIDHLMSGTYILTISTKPGIRFRIKFVKI